MWSDADLSLAFDGVCSSVLSLKCTDLLLGFGMVLALFLLGGSTSTTFIKRPSALKSRLGGSGAILVLLKMPFLLLLGVVEQLLVARGTVEAVVSFFKGLNVEQFSLISRISMVLLMVELVSVVVAESSESRKPLSRWIVELSISMRTDFG